MDVKDLAQWLGARLDRLEEKMDHVSVNVAQNTSDLTHHIARTDALEMRVEQVDKDAKVRSVAQEKELRPMKQYMERAKGAAALVGVIVTVLELLHRLL